MTQKEKAALLRAIRKLPDSQKNYILGYAMCAAQNVEQRKATKTA